MRGITAVEVMKVILDRYSFVKDSDDYKLFDQRNVRQDELIIVMREILDKEAELQGWSKDDEELHFDLVEQAEELDEMYNAIETAAEDGVRENKQVGCFDEDHF